MESRSENARNAFQSIPLSNLVEAFDTLPSKNAPTVTDVLQALYHDHPYVVTDQRRIQAVLKGRETLRPNEAWVWHHANPPKMHGHFIVLNPIVAATYQGQLPARLEEKNYKDHSFAWRVGAGRTDDTVCADRWLVYLETDDKPPRDTLDDIDAFEAAHGPCFNVVVLSGDARPGLCGMDLSQVRPGKSVHAKACFNRPVSAERQQHIQAKLAVLFTGDMAIVKNASRLMRLGGARVERRGRFRIQTPLRASGSRVDPDAFEAALDLELALRGWSVDEGMAALNAAHRVLNSTIEKGRVAQVTDDPDVVQRLRQRALAVQQARRVSPNDKVFFRDCDQATRAAMDASRLEDFAEQHPDLVFDLDSVTASVVALRSLATQIFIHAGQGITSDDHERIKAAHHGLVLLGKARDNPVKREAHVLAAGYLLEHGKPPAQAVPASQRTKARQIDEGTRERAGALARRQVTHDVGEDWCTSLLIKAESTGAMDTAARLLSGGTTKVRVFCPFHDDEANGKASAFLTRRGNRYAIVCMSNTCGGGHAYVSEEIGNPLDRAYTAALAKLEEEHKHCDLGALAHKIELNQPWLSPLPGGPSRFEGVNTAQRVLEMKQRGERVAYVASQLGSGKTTLLSILLEASKEAGERALLISPRRSLSCYQAKTLGIENYLDHKGEIDEDHLTVVLNSLLRVKTTQDGCLKNYDCIIFDESETIACHMVGDTMMRNHLVRRIWEQLAILVQAGARLVFLDAHLSPLTLRFARRLRALDPSARRDDEVYVCNTWQRPGRTHVFHEQREDMTRRMLEHILEGRPVAACYSRKSEAKAAALAIQQLFAPIDARGDGNFEHGVREARNLYREREYERAVKVFGDSAEWVARRLLDMPRDEDRRAPRVLCITADTALEPDQAAFLEDPDTNAHKWDVIISSPAMGTGVSVDTFDVGEVFGFMTPAPYLTPDDVAQHMARFRRALTWHLHISPHHQDLETQRWRLDRTKRREIAGMLKKSSAYLPASIVETHWDPNTQQPRVSAVSEAAWEHYLDVTIHQNQAATWLLAGVMALTMSSGAVLERIYKDDALKESDEDTLSPPQGSDAAHNTDEEQAAWTWSQHVLDGERRGLRRLANGAKVKADLVEAEGIFKAPRIALERLEEHQNLNAERERDRWIAKRAHLTHHLARDLAFDDIALEVDQKLIAKTRRFAYLLFMLSPFFGARGAAHSWLTQASEAQTDDDGQVTHALDLIAADAGARYRRLGWLWRTLTKAGVTLDHIEGRIHLSVAKSDLDGPWVDWCLKHRDQLDNAGLGRPERRKWRKNPIRQLNRLLKRLGVKLTSQADAFPEGEPSRRPIIDAQGTTVGEERCYTLEQEQLTLALAWAAPTFERLRTFATDEAHDDECMASAHVTPATIDDIDSIEVTHQQPPTTTDHLPPLHATDSGAGLAREAGEDAELEDDAEFMALLAQFEGEPDPFDATSSDSAPAHRAPVLSIHQTSRTEPCHTEGSESARQWAAFQRAYWAHCIAMRAARRQPPPLPEHDAWLATVARVGVLGTLQELKASMNPHTSPTR